MSTGESIEADVAQAIADAIAKHEGGFVLKWVAIVETSDDQGERGLWTMTSEDVKAWDTVGLLTHGLHLQQKQIFDSDY